MTDEQTYFRALQKIQNGCYCYTLAQIKAIVDDALNPVPQYEDVEVVRFECLTCGFIEVEDCTSPNECCRNDARITLKGSYSVRKKPKEFRREEIAFDMNFIEALVCGGKRIPLSAKYYAEWAE
jgi:hypothetical protein